MLCTTSVLLVLVAAGSARASQVGSDPRVPPAPSASLESDYEALHKRFIAAWSRYQEARTAARSATTSPAPAPQDPSAGFWAPFHELAARGESGAIRWCIERAEVAGLDATATRGMKLDLYRQLIALYSDRDWMVEVATEVRRAHAARSIDTELASLVCGEIAGATSNEKVRRQALYNQALVWMASGELEHEGRAVELFERLIAEQPTGDLADRARGKITQIRELKLGMQAPDFATSDVDGVAFRLSDFRGRVTVVVFWGFWCAPCRAMLPHEKELVRDFSGRPFALVGVNTDEDPAQFRSKAREQGVTWRTSWQGSTTGPWCKAWGVTSFPTVYVLDAHGVIRHVNVRDAALARAVEELVLECEAEARAGTTGREAR